MSHHVIEKIFRVATECWLMNRMACQQRNPTDDIIQVEQTLTNSYPVRGQGSFRRRANNIERTWLGSGVCEVDDRDVGLL